MNDKNAIIEIVLKADDGYSSTTRQRISLDQYAAIMEILNKK